MTQGQKSALEHSRRRERRSNILDKEFETESIFEPEEKDYIFGEGGRGTFDAKKKEHFLKAPINSYMKNNENNVKGEYWDEIRKVQ